MRMQGTIRAMLALGCLFVGAACLNHGVAHAAVTAKGNALRGKDIYEDRCAGCHSVDAHRIGPLHRGVVGRRAGTVPGFVFSRALGQSKLLWTPENLNTWLSNPSKLVPGEKMRFALDDAQQRADVIRYLQTLKSSPNPLAGSKP